ncbi:MAG: manganese efflux pump [Lachnospiraceae bacterium]|nr:manganese efflux pump [Lachnospiraceae bacterium]
MEIWELLLLAVGLSMDAFAVSICKGLSVSKLKIRHAFIVGVYFGGFQAAMPLIGYLLGKQFQALIVSVDHWIAFGLLLLIGANMIREALSEEEEEGNASFAFRTMLPLAVATSIDALAVGVTFAFLEVSIFPAISVIGITTFLLSAAGIKIGNIFGAKYQKKAEIFGGVVLILLGVKILLEHLGIIAF